MGWFSGKADGQAYEPTRSGFQSMTDSKGRPVMLSQLTKEQRKSAGQAGAVKPPSRAERKSRTGWGSAADFKKAKGR